MTDTQVTSDDYAHADSPGKYEGNQFRRAAAYVHEITLNGFTAEECGTIEYGSGWYGLVYLTEERTALVTSSGQPRAQHHRRAAHPGWPMAAAR